MEHHPLPIQHRLRTTPISSSSSSSSHPPHSPAPTRSKLVSRPPSPPPSPPPLLAPHQQHSLPSINNRPTSSSSPSFHSINQQQHRHPLHPTNTTATATTSSSNGAKSPSASLISTSSGHDPTLTSASSISSSSHHPTSSPIPSRASPIPPHHPSSAATPSPYHPMTNNNNPDPVSPPLLRQRPLDLLPPQTTSNPTTSIISLNPGRRGVVETPIKPLDPHQQPSTLADVRAHNLTFLKPLQLQPNPSPQRSLAPSHAAIALPEPAHQSPRSVIKRIVSYEHTRPLSNPTTTPSSLRRVPTQPHLSSHGSHPELQDLQQTGSKRTANFDDELARQAEAIRKERQSRRNEQAHDLGGPLNPNSTLDGITPSPQVAVEHHAPKEKGKRRASGPSADDPTAVLVGNLIGEGHANYVLMYNMLTGIRIGVSRCQAKLKRPLTDEDYTARHKFSFDIVGNELTPSAKYDFKFKDYAPWVFRELREYFHLDPADYLLSLTAKYILSELGSPGKSGSFFYFSRDYRFIIKTIHHTEHKFLRSILRDYHEHVKANPHTLLSRFYGLHRVKLPRGRKIHFVIMNNLFPPHRDIHQTFDLKGSAIGREHPEDKAKKGAVLKDLNWIHSEQAIDLGPMKRGLFEEQLKRDTSLLQRLGIMDYSLLIGLHDMEIGNRDRLRDDQLRVFQPVADGLTRKPTQVRREQELAASALRKAVQQSDPQAFSDVNRLPAKDRSERKHFIFYQDEGGFQATDEDDRPLPMIYYLGIIDILTPYTIVKRAEHFWKGLSSDKHMISAVPPEEYGNRFLNFLLSIIRGGDISIRPRME